MNNVNTKLVSVSEFSDFESWCPVYTLGGKTLIKRMQMLNTCIYNQIKGSNREKNIREDIPLVYLDSSFLKKDSKFIVYRKNKNGDIDIYIEILHSDYYSPVISLSSFSSGLIEFLEPNDFDYQLAFEEFNINNVDSDFVSKDGVRIISNKETIQDHIKYLITQLENNLYTYDCPIFRQMVSFKLYRLKSNNIWDENLGVFSSLDMENRPWPIFKSGVKHFLESLLTQEDYCNQKYELIVSNGSILNLILSNLEFGKIPITDYSFPIPDIRIDSSTKEEDSIQNQLLFLNHVFKTHPLDLFPIFLFEIAGNSTFTRSWCIYLDKNEQYESISYLIARICTDCFESDCELAVLIPHDNEETGILLDLIEDGQLQTEHGIENLNEDSLDNIRKEFESQNPLFRSPDKDD